MSETRESHTEVVDEFLARYGGMLPTHVLDFALDVRSIIAQLEEELERLREPEPVG